MPFGKLGVPELLIILVIVVAIFGAGKLANLGGALGKGVSDFKKQVKSEDEGESEATDEPKKAESGAAEAKKAEDEETKSGEAN